MKILFVLFFSLFITAAGWSAPFGFLPGVENRDNPNSPALLLRKIVAGKPVCAVVHNLRSGDTHTEAEYLEMLRQNYQAWFNFALQTVKESGREKEFEDLLPALRTQVVVQKDCAAPDILFFILPAQEMEKACRSSAALACVDNTSVPYKLYFSPKKGLANWASGGNENMLAHELGHTLGLADQYRYGRINSSMVYHTPDSSKGIMSNAKRGITFSCDEADGLINLLDVGVYGNARGGKQGWRSFCAKRNYRYVQGRPSSNAKYAVEVELPNVVVRTFDEAGELQNTQYFPDAKDYDFDIQTVFTAEEKDKSGRLLYGTSPLGEKMYCSYVYERKRCVAVKDSANVALLEEYSPAKNMRIVSLAHSAPNNKSIWLRGFITKDEKLLVYKSHEALFEFDFSTGALVIKKQQVLTKNAASAEKEPQTVQEVLLQRKAQQAKEQALREYVEKKLLVFYDRYIADTLPDDNGAKDFAPY